MLHRVRRDLQPPGGAQARAHRRGARVLLNPAARALRRPEESVMAPTVPTQVGRYRKHANFGC